MRRQTSIEIAITDIQRRIETARAQASDLLRHADSLEATVAAIRQAVPEPVRGTVTCVDSMPILPTEIERITAEAGARWNLTAQQVRGNAKDRPRVEARREAAWRMRNLGMSYQRIGVALGGMHYTTVMHLLKQRAA